MKDTLHVHTLIHAEGVGSSMMMFACLLLLDVSMCCSAQLVSACRSIVKCNE